MASSECVCVKAYETSTQLLKSLSGGGGGLCCIHNFKCIKKGCAEVYKLCSKAELSSTAKPGPVLMCVDCECLCGVGQCLKCPRQLYKVSVAIFCNPTALHTHTHTQTHTNIHTHTHRGHHLRPVFVSREADRAVILAH